MNCGILTNRKWNYWHAEVSLNSTFSSHPPTQPPEKEEGDLSANFNFNSNSNKGWLNTFRFNLRLCQDYFKEASSASTQLNFNSAQTYWAWHYIPQACFQITFLNQIVGWIKVNGSTKMPMQSYKSPLKQILLVLR